MDTALLAVGLACVIAAIVGGGLQAFGLTIPVLRSKTRQLLLGGLGILLLSMALLGVGGGRRAEPDTGPSPTVAPSGIPPLPIAGATASVPSVLQPTAIPSPSRTAGLTIDGGTITIDSPKDREEVTCSTKVTGTVSASLRRDQSLWLLVLPSGTTPYHPQPGLVIIGNAWQVSASVGLCPQNDPQGNDRGREFDLLIGIADTPADQSFESYLAKAASVQSYGGMPLPSGFAPVQRVTVKRN